MIMLNDVSTFKICRFIEILKESVIAHICQYCTYLSILTLTSHHTCCSHVLRKDDDDWVKKCMEYEVEGSRPRGKPKRTWKEVV